MNASGLANERTSSKRKALVKRNSSALPSVNEMYNESGGAVGNPSGNNPKQVHRQKSVLIPQKYDIIENNKQSSSLAAAGSTMLSQADER